MDPMVTKIKLDPEIGRRQKYWVEVALLEMGLGYRVPKDQDPSFIFVTDKEERKPVQLNEGQVTKIKWLGGVVSVVDVEVDSQFG